MDYGDGVLRKNSYTARQLYQLPPRTVHLQSRTTLLGHIPVDWLRNSQKRAKKWAIQRPRFANRRLGGVMSKLDIEMVESFSRFRRRKLDAVLESVADENPSKHRPARSPILRKDQLADAGISEVPSEHLYRVPGSSEPAHTVNSLEFSETSRAHDHGVFRSHPNSATTLLAVPAGAAAKPGNPSEPVVSRSRESESYAPDTSMSASFVTAYSQDDDQHSNASIPTLTKPRGSFYSGSGEAWHEHDTDSDSPFSDDPRDRTGGGHQAYSNTHSHTGADDGSPRITGRAALSPESSPSRYGRSLGRCRESDSDYFDSDYPRSEQPSDEDLFNDMDFSGYNATEQPEHIPREGQRRHHLPVHTTARNYLKAILHADRLVMPSQDLRFFHKKRGAIIFRHKFIMQVRESLKHAIIPHQPTPLDMPETVTLERFKEYTVVARYTGEPLAPVALYIYREPHFNTEVEKKLNKRWTRSLKHKIILHPMTRACFFSPLDLEIVLWSELPTKSGRTRFYFFNAQSLVTQISFLYFLMNSTTDGMRVAPTLNLDVPALDLEVEIPSAKVLDISAAARREETHNPDTDIVTYKEVTRPASCPSILGTQVIGYVKDVLANVNYGNSKLPTKNCKYGLAWHRMGRVRWLIDLSDYHVLTSWVMSDTHELELREKGDTARDVVVDGKDTEEPSPIEGFCWRLTTWRGSVRKQNVATRTYLHTHDHLLFYSSPQRIVLPLLVHDGKLVETSNEEELERLASSLPEVNKIDPYPLNSRGDISWLVNSKDLNAFDKHDEYADFERRRRIRMISQSDGIIDLTSILHVKPLTKDEMFELGFVDDQNVIIKVESRQVRDQWVARLDSLIAYWRIRRAQDTENAQAVIERNARDLDYETTDSVYPALKRTVKTTNSDTWGYTPLALWGGRDIIYSSFLYQKTSKFNSFRNFFSVLTPRSLVFYNVQFRSIKIGPLATIHTQQVYYSTYRVFDLEKCYVYTGAQAADHLLVSDQCYDWGTSGIRALPRAYPDGWTSQDPEIDRCFVLWTPRRRRSAKPHLSSRTEFSDFRMVCLARSKYERDIWVSFLQDAITNLNGID